MRIGKLLHDYLLSHSLSSKHVSSYQRAVRYFCDFVGDDSHVVAIDEMRINAWIVWMHDNRRWTSRTVHNHRRCLLTLMNFGAQLGVCKPLNSVLVRKVNVPRPEPKTWTIDQVNALLAATEHLPTQYLCEAVGIRYVQRCSYADYFFTLIAIAYDTALRRGDLHALRQEHIDDDGRVRVTVSKTGRLEVRQIRPDALSRFRTLGALGLKPPPNRPYDAAWKELCKIARVPYGQLQQIRRTSATEMYRATDDIDASRALLGHSSRETIGFYVDVSSANVVCGPAR